MPEKVPSSQESPEVHIDKLLTEGRTTLGSYQKDVQQDEIWDEQTTSDRMNEKLGKHEPISLIEVYDYNADAQRRQATRILGDAEKEKRELTQGEKNEVIVAQMRVTLLESLSKATDAYMGIMEEYGRFKAAGMRADPGTEAVVFEHFARIKKAAEARTSLAEKIHAGQIDRKIGQEQAIRFDNELLQLLAAEDKSVPGANPEGVLPVYKLMIAMLGDHYNQSVRLYSVFLNDEFEERKNRALQGDEVLKKLLPGKDIASNKGVNEEQYKIDKDLADKELKKIGYGLKEYLDDLLIIREGASSLEQLKKSGRIDIQRLANLNAVMGRYQIQRLELSTIRHHFDQAYNLDSKQRPLPGQSSPEAIKATQSFLENQQKGSVGSLDLHLDTVEEGVLHVGVLEKGEKIWNERGRQIVVRIADAIASLETAWIPDTPGGDKGFMRDSAREFLMSGLYEAIGWPRGADGNPKEWGDLTKEEKDAMIDKQDSIEKAITRFRETKAIQNVRTSVGAARELISRKDLQAQNFLQTKEIDPESVEKDVVTKDNIDLLVAKYGAPMVYKMCFVQLQGNWELYSENYSTLLTDFHEVIGAHYDFSHLLDDFADKQAGIAELLAGLSLASLLAAAATAGVAGALTTYLLKKGGKATWWMTRKGADLSWRAGRTGGSTLLKGGKAGAKMMMEGAKRNAPRVIESMRSATERLSKLKKPPAVPLSEAAKAATAAEKATEQASKLSRAGRVLGPLGILLSGKALRDVLYRDSRLEELGEYEGIEAAIQLMELKGNKETPEYSRDLGYLRNRQKAFEIQHDALAVLTALEERFPKETNKDERIENLKQRCFALEEAARKEKIDFEKLFPITTYLMTDPEREPGNVGVNIRDINDARVRGLNYAKELEKRRPLDFAKALESQGPIEKLPELQLSPEDQQKALDALAGKGLPRDLESFEGIKSEHEDLLEAAADILEL